MAKSGDLYQELVGEVVKALDPDANVRIGVWVIGPDGRRDLDVEVRGTIDGRPYFIQIECKDWADPIGIAVVDALESKRRDFAADRAIIFSNSGFTEPALKKAARVDIAMASALKVNDDRVRIKVHKTLIAKRLSVDSWKIIFYPAPEAEENKSSELIVENLTYSGLLVQNWLALLSRKLLTDHNLKGETSFVCFFRQSEQWAYQGSRIEVSAMKLEMTCRKSWVWQKVHEKATIGIYDYIRKVVSVPQRQGYYLGCISQDGWQPLVSEPLDFEPVSCEIALGTLSFELTLLNQISPIDSSPVPNIDEIILESGISIGQGKVLVLKSKDIAQTSNGFE